MLVAMHASGAFMLKIISGMFAVLNVNVRLLKPSALSSYIKNKLF